MSPRRILPACVAGLLVLVLPACGSPRSPSGDGVVVVAAENVYGDIAARIGGSAVRVTSILSNPEADPHLFEPATANAATVAHADVAIVNGLGYDAFMDRLLAAAPDPNRIVVTMAQVVGITAAGANPHLWYDIPRVPKMAAAIAGALERAAPASAGGIRARLADFDRSLEPLRSALEDLRSVHAGEPVADTEPVPDYLLAAAGVVVRTPPDFARAIEDGTEPTPQAVAEMSDLFTGHRVRVLLVNIQARSPVTDRMRELAAANGIPVVPVTETLPPGRSFVAWQLDQVHALQRALDEGA